MEHVFEMIIVNGNYPKVETGIYRNEEDAHKHLMSIGCICTQRLSIDDCSNGHYIYEKSATSLFAGQSAVIYIRPVRLR